MRKIIVSILIVVAVLLVVSVVAVAALINRVAKQSVEHFGPQITQVGVTLTSINVSLLSGKGRIQGLEIGNPPGYKTPSAIKVGAASIDLKPTSVFSDLVLVRSLQIQDPEITIEGNLKGNNLSRILDNINTYTEQEKTSRKSGQEKPPKRFEMDDLSISGGKVRLSLSLLGGKAVTVPLADIHLTNLGKDTGGLTAGELSQKILTAVVESATKAMTANVSHLGQGIADKAKNLEQQASDSIQKAAKQFGNVLK